jgi:hypothetical protein
MDIPVIPAAAVTEVAVHPAEAHLLEIRQMVINPDTAHLVEVRQMVINPDTVHPGEVRQTAAHPDGVRLAEVLPEEVHPAEKIPPARGAVLPDKNPGRLLKYGRPIFSI